MISSKALGNFDVFLRQIAEERTREWACSVRYFELTDREKADHNVRNLRPQLTGNSYMAWDMDLEPCDNPECSICRAAWWTEYYAFEDGLDERDNV